MIELERHIEILLLDNDCVIVPNFGGFMAHHVEAHYEENQAMYYPPLRTIGFNPQLTINDSLLVQSYVDVYDISYPEALRRIESEITEVKQHLANEGSYEMNDIGTLYYQQDGNYTFNPCEAGILTPSLYGLNSLEIKPLSATLSTCTLSQKQVTEQHIEKEDKIANKAVLSEQKCNNTAITTSEELRKNKTIEIKVSYLRNLAAACLAIVAFLLFPSTLKETQNNAAMFGQIDTNLLCRIMPKDVTTKAMQVTKTTKPAIASHKVTEKPAPKALTKEPTIEKEAENTAETFYAIVLASRVTVRNATVYVDKLQKQGLTNAQVYTTHKNTKVIYGNYPTEKSAYKALNSLQHNKIFVEGWVTKITK